MSKRDATSWPIVVVFRDIFSGIADHPMRAGLLALLGLFLVWVVFTKSLPMVFARNEPSLALRLSSDHPVVLLGRAERLRTRLLELVSEGVAVGGKKDASNAEEKSGLDVARDKTPALAREKQSVVDERDRIRSEIRSLARRVVASDPLNARAVRLLAEVTDDPERVRELMLEAVKRSRREFAAVFWLLHDSFYRKDFAVALKHGDTLLRSRSQLRPYVMSYLAQIGETSEGRKLLLQRLSEAPGWREYFFQALPENSKDLSSPLKLMIALNGTENPVLDGELKPYLSYLIRKKRVGLAYNAWLQLLPEEQLTNIGLLNNPSFESVPNGLVFDWKISSPLNAVVEVVELHNDDGQHALHVGFGSGRVKFPPVRQVVTLAPGKYRLEGKFRGSIIAKRGMRWQLQCLYGRKKVVGESQMLLGQVSKWRAFSFEMDVPSEPDCGAQMVVLMHDARSASEELISGDVWFDDLRLSRIQD